MIQEKTKILVEKGYRNIELHNELKIMVFLLI